MSTHRPPSLRSSKATSFDGGCATENDPCTLLLQHHVVDLELGKPPTGPEHKLSHEFEDTTRPRPIVRHHNLIRIIFVVLAALLTWHLLCGPVGVFPQLDPAAPNHMDGLRRF
ncbi:MAG: hypothetical protein Q9173_002500 [Seirophora scorigena]